MNAILALSLITASVLAAVGLAILALVIVGIHREERRLSLPTDPRSPIDILARRVLGFHISQPSARRILAARYAPSPAMRPPAAPPTGSSPRARWPWLR